jgi:hemerythrin-like domain-containing protein
MKSTRLLKADHDIILRALHVLREIIAELEQGKEIDNTDVRSLLAFLRDFADGCHHVKEEVIFFPALVEAGLPFGDGPVRVMSYEHERGRTLTSAMSESLDHNKKEDFLIAARRYITLLTEHIEKENKVLFDIADRTLADEEDQKVADAFEEFEKTIVGIPAYERLQSAIESLASKYLHAVV